MPPGSNSFVQSGQSTHDTLSNPLRLHGIIIKERLHANSAYSLVAARAAGAAVADLLAVACCSLGLARVAVATASFAAAALCPARTRATAAATGPLANAS